MLEDLDVGVTWSPCSKLSCRFWLDYCIKIVDL